MKKITREDIKRDRNIMLNLTLPQDRLDWVRKLLEKLTQIGENIDVTKSRK